ncbi:MAG: hypothetical protein ACR2HD_07345 [Solirubrobacteraceae bacterium]
MAGPYDRTGRFIARLTDDPDAAASRMAGVDIDIVATRLTPAVEIAVAMTATLLLRLDKAAPRLHLDVPAGRTTRLPRLGEGSLLDELGADHSGFSSVDRFTGRRSADPSLRLVFDGEAVGLTVQSAGWACALGALLPDVEGNPLAAAFAGVLASAEALKVALRAAGATGRIRDWRGAASLWDYSLTPTIGSDIPDTVDLDGVAFVGCGGVASAIAWPLSFLSLSGAPLAVDDDTIDDTNPNRHLTASLRDVRRGKADLFAALLRSAGAAPVVEAKRWDAVEAQRRSTVGLGVISVDDDAVRRAFQLDMPRLVLNGGTNDAGLYQATSHDFLNEACLGCVARADLNSAGPEESLARRLGISLQDLQPHLSGDAPLPADLLSRIGAEDRQVLRGVRGRDVARVACGHLRPLPDEPAVSAPMLSAAPGVLLAAEVVKRAMGSDKPLSPVANMVATSILTGPHDRWLTARHKRSGCECQDPAYRSFYLSRWEASARFAS